MYCVVSKGAYNLKCSTRPSSGRPPPAWGSLCPNVSDTRASETTGDRMSQPIEQYVAQPGLAMMIYIRLGQAWQDGLHE